MEKGNTAAIVYPDLLWAGTDHSLALAIEAEAAIRAAVLQAGPWPGEDDEEELPYMLSVQGSVGIVSIRGPLVTRDSPYNRYYGISSYADIRRALIAAAQKPEIEGILLDIDSGGGAVNGVSDTAELIRRVDSAKPVWAYTEGTMASAAYWLGCSARRVFSSDTSIVGSIGVICTHMEYTEMFKEAGIGVTVKRAGKYKALANPYEKLSETGAKQIEAQLDAAYGVFVSHVADSRNVSFETADEKMAQGREFMGKDAEAAGLVDGISGFDAVFGGFQAKLLDTAKVTQHNSGQYNRGAGMGRNALTEKEIAAMAAGVAPEVAATVVTAPTAPTDHPATNPAPAATSEPAPVATPAAAPAADATVKVLSDQLAAANEQLVARGVELAQANTRIAALEAAQAGLVVIAGQSLSNMRVALGGNAIDASKMSVDTLLAEHASTVTTFRAKFKAGGVAASTPQAPENTLAQAPDHLSVELVKATRFVSN